MHPTETRVPSTATTLYLKQLCGMTGRSYDSISLEDFAGIDERGEVNKKFFSSSPESETTSLEISQEEELRQFFNASIPVQKLTEQRQALETDLAQWSDKINQTISMIVEKDRVIQFWQNRDKLPAIQDVQELLRSGKIKLISIDTRTQVLKFETINDTILREIKPEAGVNRSVNLGTFFIEASFASNSVKVLRSKNNLNPRGTHIHPHIHSNGGVCWGNAGDTVRRAFASFDVKSVIETTLLILAEYNPNSPYVPLHEFERKAKENERFGDLLFPMSFHYVYDEFLKTIPFPGRIHMENPTSITIGDQPYIIKKVQIYYFQEKLYLINNLGEEFELPFGALCDEENPPKRFGNWTEVPKKSSLYALLISAGREAIEEKKINKIGYTMADPFYVRPPVVSVYEEEEDS